MRAVPYVFQAYAVDAPQAQARLVVGNQIKLESKENHDCKMALRL